MPPETQDLMNLRQGSLLKRAWRVGGSLGAGIDLEGIHLHCLGGEVGENPGQAWVQVSL